MTPESADVDRPGRDEVLTLDDVPEAPNGTATIYRVATDPQHTASTVATVGKNGVLRSLDGDRAAFDAERCEILGVDR